MVCNKPQYEPFKFVLQASGEQISKGCEKESLEIMIAYKKLCTESAPLFPQKVHASEKVHLSKR